MGRPFEAYASCRGPHDSSSGASCRALASEEIGDASEVLLHRLLDLFHSPLHVHGLRWGLRGVGGGGGGHERRCVDGKPVGTERNQK